jgi:polyphosphate glucokinase
MVDPYVEEKILSVDIGGSRIKAILLDSGGQVIKEYTRMDTPKPADPERVMETIAELSKNFEDYRKVSVGFPGYVRKGVVYTAPNLGTDYWQNYPLSEKLRELLAHPVRIVNDADLQGLGIAQGVGLEMVITLGTGFGTSLLIDGVLLPHMELAHHRWSNDKEYDDYIGNRGYLAVGQDKWNKRLRKVLANLRTVFNYDFLYISGGNAKKIDFKLDDNIRLATNLDGIRGGAKLWQKDHYNV